MVRKREQFFGSNNELKQALTGGIRSEDDEGLKRLTGAACITQTRQPSGTPETARACGACRYRLP